jgi:hypothetical protein
MSITASSAICAFVLYALTSSQLALLLADPMLVFGVAGFYLHWVLVRHHNR